MNLKTYLTDQTKNSYEWVIKLLKSIPHEKWDTTPEVVESNIHWQAGHLILSIYYHTVIVIRGHHQDILKSIDMKGYSNKYSFNSKPSEEVKGTDPIQLLNELDMVMKVSLETISGLSKNDFIATLEPSRLIHPVAKIKQEAIEWNIKHTMWHCGQISLLKRILHERYDFGVNYQ